MASKMQYEITFPFTNTSGATIEVWRLISYFILYFIMVQLLIHSGIKIDKLVREAPDGSCTKDGTIAMQGNINVY